MTQQQIIKKQTTQPKCHCGKRADKLLHSEWVCNKCADRILKRAHGAGDDTMYKVDMKVVAHHDSTPNYLKLVQREIKSGKGLVQVKEWDKDMAGIYGAGTHNYFMGLVWVPKKALMPIQGSKKLKELRSRVEKLEALIDFKQELLSAMSHDKNGKKILDWMKGKKVEDSPTKSSRHTIDFSEPETAELRGPFGTVTLERHLKGSLDESPNPQKIRKTFYFLEYRQNTGNNGSEDVTDFTKAVYKFAYTAWHLIIRGVIH